MTSIDPHFYVYQDTGFDPAPSVIDWTLVEVGEDSEQTMHANGWILDTELGQEDSECQFRIYRPVMKEGESISADGRRLVEFWDSCSCVWTALVEPPYWPKFYRHEIMPMLSHGHVEGIHEQLKRLANAVIGAARYTHAISSDIDRYSGEALKDIKKDQALAERYRANAN